MKNSATGSEVKREENPFSFKHFLRRDANSATGTATATATATASTTSKELHNHQGQKTGARPKIPLNMGNSSTTSTADIDSIKMKRSPKFFKSFDSQASLAEIASTSGPASHQSQPGESVNSNMYQPYHSSFNNDSSSKDSRHTQNKTMFQRSYSTYDLDNPKAYKSFGRSSGCAQKGPNYKPNSSISKTTAAATEISMALPDFVQDHIALEMFYSRFNDSANISPLSVEYDQLPDFAINENDTNNRYEHSKQIDKFSLGVMTKTIFLFC